MSRATLRIDVDRAAGAALLPEGWQRIVAHVPALLEVADAAAAALGVDAIGLGPAIDARDRLVRALMRLDAIQP